MRILVIRRDNIGDLACTTPLLDGLRRAQPGAWIGVLANTYNAEVLARNHAVDTVFAYEKLKHRERPLFGFMADRVRLAIELRRHRPDWILVPAPAPQAVQYARGLKAGRIVLGDTQDGRHEVLRTWAVGKELGVVGEPGPMHVYPDPARVAQVRVFGDGRPVVAVHVSARRPKQRWPESRYIALVAEIAARQPVMLLWSPGLQTDARHPGDDEMAARILEATKGLPVRGVETRELASLVAALSVVDCVICPDGGAMHLAAALGKPVVALFGDSPVQRWRPWGVRHRVVRPDSGDLADLPVDAVLAAHAELSGIGRDQDRA